MNRWSLGAAILFTAILGSATASAQSGWLLVANKGDQAMGIVDPAAEKQVAEVPEGGETGHEIIASPDGKLAYVPIYGNSGVGMPGTNGRNMVVIDIASRKIVGNLDFGKGVRPHCPKFGPKDGLLYVSTELEKSIAVIDPKTLKIVGEVPTGQEQSHMFVINSENTRAYSANVGPGTVSVIDLKARKVLHIIPVSGQVQRIAITPDDKLIFTSDVTKPQLAVIDTATNQIKTWIPMPGLGYGSEVTRDGRWLLVVNPLVSKLAVIDLHEMKVTHTVDLPNHPQEVLIAPDQKTAYVSSDKEGQVAVVRLADWTVTKVIDTGKGADGLAWAAAH